MSQLIYAENSQLVGAVVAPRPTTDEAQPGRPRRRGGQGVRVAILCVLTVVAVAFYFAKLRSVDIDSMTGLGLISVLPVSMLIGLGLHIVGFIGALSLPQRCVWLLCAQLVLLVLMLHGSTMLLESAPRFQIAWAHAGFVEFVNRTGTTAPALDYRWSWPGFFGLAAFWIGSGKLETLRTVLTVMPVLNNLLYLVALGLLMTTFRMSWQAKWLAALFFCLLNWVGQDYFSPQGWTFLLYLLFVGFLIMWFRTPHATSWDVPRPFRWGSRLWQRLWGDASPGELPRRTAGSAECIVVLAVLVGLFATATVSHQLTPFAMLITSAGLVVARRCALTGLPVLLGVMLMAWISYMTQAYWAGHFYEVMSGVGDVGGSVSSNGVSRASLGNADHQLVVRARMVSAVLVFLMAGCGLIRRRRRGIEDRVLLVLTAAPVGLALMQSYGGEMALRVYLFALAPACVLGALAFFPCPTSRPSTLARCGAGVCALVLMLCFFVTRYGNEAFERISDGAVSAVQKIYEENSGIVKFLYTSNVSEVDYPPFMPLGYRDLERVRLVNMKAPIDPSDVTEVLRNLRDQGPGTFLITTRSQEAFLEIGQEYPKDWGERLRHALAAAPGVRVVVENADAAVYTLDWPPGSVAKPVLPPPTGLQLWRTPWTPLGVAFLVMLLGVLGTREALGVRLAPDELRRLRPLTFAAVPLLVGFVLVVFERFVLLIS
ncbi:hypothetical protein Mycsm_05791 [Mycobacterium sp. JS623]|uniref:hypothetical protein n=1 Tax=Mycobacterium sp. JS623 TaxID=212767 RepID=UPI0002A5BB06|nr:hypothetical protein [Mycobacterium sp. JS623]AGB25963.1 hypothetical protein Mycsm_05791 [Mycobacterium sp. JS623]